jgi:hypothetical protein
VDLWYDFKCVYNDPVAWTDLSCEVVFKLHIYRLRLLSAAQVLRRLLHSDLLGIHELGLGKNKLERAAAVAGLVLALEVGVLELGACLLLVKSVSASLALERARTIFG